MIGFSEAMVTRNVEYCGQQVNYIMQVDSCQIAIYIYISMMENLKV